MFRWSGFHTQANLERNFVFVFCANKEQLFPRSLASETNQISLVLDGGRSLILIKKQLVSHLIQWSNCRLKRGCRTAPGSAQTLWNRHLPRDSGSDLLPRVLWTLLKAQRSLSILIERDQRVFIQRVISTHRPPGARLFHGKTFKL